ncbi:unnamed protein product [Symbiodinium natans]|uniref:Uncharacterized protein n=1 Tax=Symbiodinium natans TaxID=878477 RepID=A0A812USQ6_9DINO|nr:unnamed protein product [Symbiodinium natans]
MSSRNVDIAVLAEILEEVLRDAASAMDLVSALPLPCRERIVAALVYQTRFCGGSDPAAGGGEQLIVFYDVGGGCGGFGTDAYAHFDGAGAHFGCGRADDGSGGSSAGGPAGVLYGPSSSSAPADVGGVLFNPAAMDDDSEEVVAPNVAMVAQVTDPVVELPPVVLPGDLPSIQPTDVAPDIAEPVVVAPEPTPDASNDVITTETTAGRLGGGLWLHVERAWSMQIQRSTRSWTDLDRLHVAALQETRDNARAAARLEAAVAAQGEAYVAYKARVERRGARAEHFPAPSSDLAQLLVSTYGDLLSREEATADAQGG